MLACGKSIVNSQLQMCQHSADLENIAVVYGREDVLYSTVNFCNNSSHRMSQMWRHFSSIILELLAAILNVGRYLGFS